MEQPKVTSDGAPALIALGALLAYERRHHVIASHSVEAAQLILDAEDALKCRVCSGSGWVAHKHGIDDGYGEADACRACEPARHITTAERTEIPDKLCQRCGAIRMREIGLSCGKPSSDGGFCGGLLKPMVNEWPVKQHS